MSSRFFLFNRLVARRFLFCTLWLAIFVATAIPAKAAAPTITSFSPSFGEVGTTVTIVGTNFTNVTSVIFNSTFASGFTPSADGTRITTAVPSGATTGRISLLSPDGNVTSSKDFTVTTANTPKISINDITVTEGTGANVTATFTVTLSVTSQQTVTVNAATTDGTAKAASDYTTNSATLSFAPGQTSLNFSVSVLGDSLDEENEAFYVLLTSAQGGVVTKGRGVCTIADNDDPPTITIEDVSIGEGTPDSGTSSQRVAVFRLHLSAASGKLVKVNYATSVGTATAGNDYVAVNPTQIAFTVGQTVTLARVLINGDSLNEANETFFVNLSSAINATISDTQALGVILNDDAAPAISINDVSISEGNSGVISLTFNVTLSAASGQTVYVNFATADGIARSTSDYGARNGTLIFSPGITSQNVVISVVGDTTVEGNETLYVLLSSAINASIRRGRGVGTILNDDTSL